jgi:hypothetical protein
MFDIKTKTLIDRRELLRIKALSLQMEVGFIRNEEDKQRRFSRRHAIDPILQREMEDHRKKHLRPIARQTNIARGFIKGLTLPQMEQYPKNLLTHADWDAIKAMVKKYGSNQSLLQCGEQCGLYLGKVYGTAPKVTREKKPWPFPEKQKVTVTE